MKLHRLCHIKEPDSSNHADFSLLKSLLMGLPPDAFSEEDFTFELPEKSPISAQLGIGSCAANAGGDAWEYIMPFPVIQVSRLALYWLARNYHGATLKDEGTYISYVFDVPSRYGLVPETEWPYDVTKVFYQPPLEVFMVGHANKINSYYKIRSEGEQRLNDIDAALFARLPVVFGTGVDTAFQKYYQATEEDEATGLRPPNKIDGYHAMMIVGVRRRRGRREYKIRNSWGTLWGRFGYTWFDQDYIMWNETTDLWCPTTMPKLVA